MQSASAAMMEVVLMLGGATGGNISYPVIVLEISSFACPRHCW